MYPTQDYKLRVQEQLLQQLLLQQQQQQQQKQQQQQLQQQLQLQQQITSGMATGYLNSGMATGHYGIATGHLSGGMATGHLNSGMATGHLYNWMATCSLGKYTGVTKLGNGAFGTVYKGKYSNEDYAIKEIQNMNEYAIQEIQILKNTNHGHIIKYIESWFSNYGFLYIVMEYADQGTLLLQRYLSVITSNEASVWRFFEHMGSALHYLHGMGIIHRDFKPDNILVVTSEKGNLIFKVADFGIAKLFGDEIQSNPYANSYIGTYCYMAPEVLRREPYTWNADLWALGAVMSFVCNNGVHLFSNTQEILTWPCGMSPLDWRYPDELRQIVVNLLNPNYKSRPSAAYIEEFITVNELSEE